MGLLQASFDTGLLRLGAPLTSITGNGSVPWASVAERPVELPPANGESIYMTDTVQQVTSSRIAYLEEAIARQHDTVQMLKSSSHVYTDAEKELDKMKTLLAAVDSR